MTIKKKIIVISFIFIAILMSMGLIIHCGYHFITGRASLLNNLDREAMYLQMMLRGLNEAILNDGMPSSFRTEKEGLEGFDRLHTYLMSTVKDPDIQAVLIEKIDPEWKSIKDAIKPFLDHYIDLNDDELITEAGKVIVKTEHLVERVNELAERSRAIVDKNSKISALVLRIIAIIFIPLILLSLMIAYYLYRTIMDPISELTAIAEGLNKDHVSTLMDESRNDEFGSVARMFNKSMRKTLSAKDQLRNRAQELKKLNTHLRAEIIERKKAEKRIRHMAYHDSLTGLPNRHQFTKRVSRLLERPKRHRNYQFAVLLMDLDRFKVINDSLGHLTGDSFLKAVAGRLESVVRLNDFVSRFGGDEFAILLDDIEDTGDAIDIADRVLDELSKPFSVSGHEIVTTTSIGISLSATNYRREDDLIRDADTAMYCAKAKGRGRYEIFDSRLLDNAKNTLQLEADLWRAVENMEFLVYYQPIISASSGRIVAAEALLRWQHPERGFISPVEFIPLAEEMSLISPIGEWLLETVCSQMIEWLYNGHQINNIGVNFSSRQFQDAGLAQMVNRVLTETGLESRFLNVEITESIAMEHNSINILNELASMGVQTSVDDFGTGYSSLGSIKSFPINVLKIDKVFIKDIEIDPNVEAIIKAIIAMAHALKMKVIAEGVETETQYSFLRSHLCDELQGYLFSPPVSSDEFTTLLQKRILYSFETSDNQLVGTE